MATTAGGTNNEGGLARRRLLCVAVLVLSVFVLVAAGSQITFVEPLQSWIPSNASQGAYGLAVADFNHDGKLDVAFLQGLAPYGPFYVSVMLGNGNGTFAPPVNVFSLPTNDSGDGVLARDFNGDGKMDIAFTIPQLNEIVVLPGNGDGTFGTAIVSPTALSPALMQTADLNGDGKLDVVVLDQSSNMVSVLFGKGDGTFGSETDYALGGTNPQDLALADLNGDHHPDIIVGDYDSETVNVLLNDGTGKFATATGSPFSVGMQVLGLEVADFNGDGKLDIATAGFGSCSPGPSTLRVSLGNGDGTFQVPLAPQCISGYAPSRHYSDNQPIDINGDGKPDIVFGNANNNEIDVGLGNGDGTFTQAVYVASQGVAGAGISFVDGIGVADVAVADFNGDGLPDLLAAEYGGNRQGGISLLPAVRAGAFAAPGVFQSGGGGNFHTVAVGDFNGDGKLDAAVLSGEGNGGGAGILLGNGDGTFGPVTNTPGCNCSGEFYSWLDTASFHDNGVLDLLILANSGVQAGPPPRVIVQYGVGNGTFGGEAQIYAASSPGDPYFYPVGAAIGDLNGDGNPEIVVFSSYPNANFARLYVFVNDGGGGFGAPNIIELGAQTANSDDRAVAIGDFNGDGKPDLMTHTVDLSNVEHIFFVAGKGDGTFAAPVDLGSYGDATQGIIRYFAADMNGDGKLDLVGLGFGHGVYVSLGNGNGTIQAAKEYTADQGFLTDMGIADFDGDGKPDVAVVGQCCGGPTGPQGLAVLRNNGNGTLAAALHPSIGETIPRSLAVGDVNGDGSPDFIMVISGSSNQMDLAAVLNGASPVATLLPASLNFGNQVINTTSLARAVTLSNTGTAALKISSITPSGDFAISANSCGASLAAGKKCKVSVTFTPTSLGKLAGTLTFTDNAHNNPQKMVLTGMGVSAATLTPAKATYAPQTVGTTSLAKTFTLTNNQSVDLTSIAISTTGDFAVSATTCTATLGAKKKCTISVTFKPTQKGTRTGTLIVSDSANNSPQTSNLTGTGK